MTSARVYLLVAWLFAAVAARATVTEVRFSRTLTATEQSATGLGKLSSDQLAILDALVRHDDDLKARSSKPRAARFSERLSADERRNAGLTLLSPAEIEALDATIDHPSESIATTSAATLASPDSRSAAVKPIYTRAAPEIHGSVTLAYGWGKGGSSERGGSMVLSFEDPEHHFAVLVGYSEVHAKGPAFARDCTDGYLPRGFGELR